MASAPEPEPRVVATSLVDSRQGPGTLTIATIERSYQVSNVRLEPDISETDGTPTLAVPAPAPLATVAWKLSGTTIQDWEKGLDGFVNYLMDHALQQVPFVWTPKTTVAGLKYQGTVQLRPAIIGGDVGVQATADFELPVVGVPTRSEPT